MVRVKHILQFSYYTIWIYIQFHEKNMYFRSSVNYTVRKVLYKVFVTLRKCHDIGKNNERNFSLLGSKLLGRGRIIIISIGGCKMKVCTHTIYFFCGNIFNLKNYLDLLMTLNIRFNSMIQNFWAQKICIFWQKVVLLA